MSSALTEPLRTLERLAVECSTETQRLDKMRETLWSIEYPKSMLDTGSGYTAMVDAVSSPVKNYAGPGFAVKHEDSRQDASLPGTRTNIKASVGSTLSATRTESKADVGSSTPTAPRTELKARPRYVNIPSTQLGQANDDTIVAAESSSFASSRNNQVYKPRVDSAVAESEAPLDGSKGQEGGALATSSVRDNSREEFSQEPSGVGRPIPEVYRSASALGDQSTALSAVLKRAVGGGDSSSEEEAAPAVRSQRGGRADRSKSAGIAKLLGSLGGSTAVVATEGDDDDEFDM
ncbi:hypothetical protein FOL47_002001 [Perkinsus chesapeaki]|uniref:Uncharacterized protein n=1 Tax=Perkinsus chesapeaki TaxID=330153 RepID=A0A7J6MGD8_PERCH|nr:hypothetical protein FOL47_002001 [Perkinsus chesapeaki]